MSNFLVGDFEEALANFNDTLLYLRGNRNIDYEQLGLKYKLHSCEVLFNRGLCYIYLQQEQIGMQDLQFAAREKSTPDHDVIDEAIREKAEGYTVFSIPIGTIYRPNEAKVKNLKTKNYLGSARLVATRDLNHLDADGRRHIQAANLAVDDRPSDKLSYGALNLVRPGLTSRSRQQSEPPMHRNVFPPTPPPEMVERPPSSASRRRSGDSLTSQKSNRTAASKPRKLDLSLAGFERPQVVPERPRLGTVRSASERPRANREYSSSSPRSLGQRRGDTRSLVEDPSQHRSESQPKQQQQHQLQPQAYHARSKSTTRDLMHRPVSIEEEDETETETETEITPPSTTSSDHDPPLAFEIITRPPHHRSRSSRGGAPKPSASPPAPPLRKIRVKVYAEDTRYVMILPSVRYEDFEQQVRVKFGLRGEFRLKMRDEEGDMVTMADQEDLDMAVASCREGAGRERCEMGKMEVSLSFFFTSSECSLFRRI